MPSIIHKILGRLLYDPMVRNGCLPHGGLLNEMFKTTGSGRIVRTPAHHPLINIHHLDLPENPFALSRSTLIWLWAYLAKSAHKNILEMGSGKSTLLLSLYAKQQAAAGRKVHIHTLESDKEWIIRSKTHLKKLGTADYVTLHYAVAKKLDGRFGGGYQLDEHVASFLFPPLFFDLLFIDGPVTTIGRGFTLPLVFEYLSPSATIFLDDAFRENEQSHIRLWLAHFQNKLKHLGTLPLGKGLAHLKKSSKP